MKRFLLVVSCFVFHLFLVLDALAQANQTVINGQTVQAVVFPGTGCTYNWLNDTPGIGLPVSGAGNIPSFTAVNTGAKPIVATITATPVPGGLAYIANRGSNNVSVINTASNKVVATIPVGTAPFGVMVSKDGSRAYVVNATSAGISVINTATNTVVFTLPINYPDPYSVALSPDGNWAYAPSHGYNNLSVMNTTTGDPTYIDVPSPPYAVAISPDGNHVYVTQDGDGGAVISVINTSNNKVATAINVPAHPHGIMVSPDGTTVYVTSETANNVTVINAATNTVTGTIATGTSPEGVTISPDGKLLYTANQISNDVSVINTATQQLVATVPVDAGAIGISLTPDGKFAYVTCSTAGTVDVISAATNKVIATVPVGNTPDSQGNFVINSMGCEPVKFTITINPNPAPAPGITATTAKGATVSCAGTASASPAIQQFTVSGGNLTADIIATAPTGFEVSLAPGNAFGNSVTLSQSGGTVNGVVIYVRSAANAPSGNLVGKITLASGALSQTVEVNGFVSASVGVNPVSNQVVKDGETTAAVNFTSAAGTVSWTNDTPGIGLPASGTGSIASFKAVNTSTKPIKATITVTPLPVVTAYIPLLTASYAAVVNTVNNNALSYVPVGQNCWGVAVSPDGSKIYIGNRADNTISVIETSTNNVIATIPVPDTPYGIVVSPDGKNVYVIEHYLNKVAVIDVATNKIVSTLSGGDNSLGITISPDGSRLYLADYMVSDATVTVINTITGAVEAKIAMLPSPTNLVLSPDGITLYVSNTYSNTVTVVNTANNTVKSVIPLGFAPYGLTISPDGSKLYVGIAGDNNVSVVNTLTNQVITTLGVGLNPEGMSISSDGSFVFVAGNGGVSIINTATNSLLRTVETSNNGHYYDNPISMGNFVVPGTPCSVPVIFTITVNPTNITALATITATGSPTAITTIYGTQSASSSFSVEGVEMNEGILVTPPPGFEVSADNVNFSSTITVGASGNIVTTQVYIRETVSNAVGNYSGNIVLSSAGVTDVNVAMPVSTVTPAALTVTAADATKTYGAPNPVLTVTYSGFVNGDSQASLTTQPDINITATATSPVGTYPITAGNATDNNYSITYLPGSLSVRPVALTITAANATKIYGATNPVLTATYSGFVNDDTPASLTTAPVISTTASVNSAVGTYPITATSATDANYTIAYVPGVLTISPATLTITATSVTKNYGTALTGAGAGSAAFTSTGLQNSENIGSITTAYGTGTAATDNAGTYSGSITATAATGGTFNPGNYTIIYLPGNIIVTPVPLTIIADDKVKIYGDINPVLTVGYIGFVNSDGQAQLTAQPVVTTTADVNSPVGQYPITVSGAVAQNYNISYLPGVLTVELKPATIIIPNTFTPNNDGINDNWVIKNIEFYPNCNIEVYNRYGENVYSSIGYGIPWNGTYRGARLPTGTYYYIIDLKNKSTVLSGFVAIIR